MSGQSQSPNRKVPLPHQSADDEPPSAMTTVGDPIADVDEPEVYQGGTQSPPPPDNETGGPFAFGVGDGVMKAVEELVFCFVVVELAKRRAKSEVFGAIMASDVQTWIPELEPGDPHFELEELEIETALRRCERDGLLIGYHSDYAKSRYRLIADKVDKFYRINLTEKDTGVHQVAVLGPDWLAEMLRNLRAGSKPPRVIVATEDAWEPLPLDRNSAEYTDAINKVEAALKEIESNNGYAATEPDERNGIVESIRGTLKTIRDGFPSRRQILAGLLAPLKYVAKRFGDASMGEVAKQAVLAVAKWLSTLVS